MTYMSMRCTSNARQSSATFLGRESVAGILGRAAYRAAEQLNLAVRGQVYQMED